MRIIANAVDQLGSYRVLNDVRGYTAHAVFPSVTDFNSISQCT